ncbi:oligomycin resistance ATP-dependent permease Yor1p [[Candida] railenensis]|uniref:Oligomycin resistance ATP-dependent permease Yor1p n=1 Tax=[Candida] railenensis TaxID=45579 RepID=A0A9P0QS29_9ASCO|nr:oligomycin resistance ATP-dependent permease Yor1p [[Candida] railenensis]
MSDEVLEIGPEYEPQRRLLSRFIKGEYPIPTEEERQPHGYAKANLLSKIFFWWVTPILKTGYSRTIRPRDLFYLTDDLKIANMAREFDENLQARVAVCRHAWESDPANEGKPFRTWPKLTLAKTVVSTLRHDVVKATVLGSLCIIFMSLMPLLMKQLLKFVEAYELPYSTQPLGPGIGYAVGSSLAIMVMGFLFNHYINAALHLGIKTKSILITLVLEKSFRLSASSRKKHTAGKITSLMGTDLSRVDLGMMMQPLLIVLPIGVVIGIVILAVNLGIATLIGLGVFLFFIVLIGAGTAKMFSYREAVTKLTDNRVDIIKEVLGNLKMIKFYSWEIPYMSKIIEARSAEISAMLKIQAARNIVDALALNLTGITSFITFVCLYKIHGTSKGPAAIFSSVSAFNALATVTFLLPMCLALGVDLLHAFRRVERLLACEELVVDENYITIQDDNSDVSIDIQSADFSWDTSVVPDDEDEVKEKIKAEKAKEKKIAKLKKQGKYDEEKEKKDKKENSTTQNENSNFPGLLNVDLTVQKGEFIVITGVIGSGKSSLLNAIAGNMKLDNGKVIVNGEYLLCGEPWVQNATIKDNIVFGSEFDEKLYKRVIHACSLQQDLNSFDAGDYTEVGERGITLSGGQKARINLARAVYAQPDIILLDDVLSAVDARVGKHIMTNCILGQLSDTTRILATHQLSLIESAHKIIFLNGDGSMDNGTFEDLRNKNEGFRNLMSFSSTKKDLEEEIVLSPQVPGTPTSIDEKYQYFDGKIISAKSTKKEGFDDDCESNLEEKDKDFTKGKLHEDEEKAVNRIKWKIYHRYIKSGAGKLGVKGFLVLFPISAALSTFTNLFTNTWLSFWVSDKFEGRDSSFWMGLYALFTFTAVIFVCLEFFLLINTSTNASKNLNLAAVKNLLHAPMSFIDTTPTGRILNRFTKDTDALDNEISENLRFLFYGMANLIGILILCCIYLPWILIAVPVFGGVFVCVANYFQASTREIKRIEAVQRSFIHNNYSETLNGMSTIKAFRAERRFIGKNNACIDSTNEASLLVVANQRWLAQMLEVMVFFFTLLITLLCVNKVFNISASSTGLIISYAFSIGNELSQFIRLYTQVENDMNSAERLEAYAYRMPQEAPFEISHTKPETSWPRKGDLEFRNVSLSYRPLLPLVLKDLSFKVQPGEKIGICGRTGAGKSSIMTALFRIAELHSGSIVIDGIDISSIGLHDLRSNLSIIPQDPVLFNGTIRKNLDPFNEQDDEAIWDALRRAGVIEESEFKQVKESSFETNGDLHKFHLDQIVEEQGANFSLGERQLISFARALLKNTKILILDEATSSVDYETDSKIQKTIIREFGDCTILCIAHRLKTIINYDKILTLDDGCLSEFDTPWALFKGDGIFSQICEKSGIVDSDFIRR